MTISPLAQKPAPLEMLADTADQSFIDEAHLQAILREAQAMVDQALAGPAPQPAAARSR